MSIEELLILCQQKGSEVLGTPCQVRLYQYDGSDEDKQDFWNADLTFYTDSEDANLDYSDAFGESDTVAGALEDLLIDLGAKR